MKEIPNVAAHENSSSLSLQLKISVELSTIILFEQTLMRDSH